jgi:cytochrome c5
MMSTRNLSRALAAVACGAVVLLGVQCGTPPEKATEPPAEVEAAAVDPAGDAAAAWQVIYGVLQHPRCANCHPAGNAPLQGDDSRPHLQNVQRGPEGKGLPAMRCDTCHQRSNLASPNLPPGAPNWHLPKPEMPLVFVGMSSRELCEQMKDPARNGGKTPEQIAEHMSGDPLAMWGWDPGPGRAPVSTPHEELVRAVEAWVKGGCGCPEK